MATEKKRVLVVTIQLSPVSDLIASVRVQAIKDLILDCYSDVEAVVCEEKETK